MRHEHIYGHAHPCPFTLTDNSGGTTVDVTAEIPTNVFRRIVGLVSTHVIDALQIKVLRGITDQVRVGEFTLPQNVFLPIAADLGNYAAVEDKLWIQVTGTKTAGVVVRLTVLLSMEPSDAR